MFSGTEDYYDLIYRTFKNYRAEAQALQARIESLHPLACTILDAACGTGEHHQYLSARFLVEGIDLNAPFLQIARQKNPECRYSLADMRDFSLGRTFDVVTCLFGSIGYVRTVDGLMAAFSCFRSHLGRDGLLIVEPWFTPERWVSGKLATTSVTSDELHVCRMARGELRGGLSVLELQYLVGAPQDGIRHFREEHEMGLFRAEEMLVALAATGFEAIFDEQGLMDSRGLYVARAVHGAQSS
ncbi:MAG: class I SAM-dependent methyltransferase [Candidatus Schekmanbacteria bacterium]|nr:class I SAM-dependent methyltransferase [Candidatus Schekmanbacteria bacterium]